MTLNTEDESYQALVKELESIVAVAMSTPGTKPRDVAERIAQMDPLYCPWDCDHCHSEDCPCDRAGCSGSDVRFQTP
jgi:hypothetical protein